MFGNDVNYYTYIPHKSFNSDLIIDDTYIDIQQYEYWTSNNPIDINNMRKEASDIVAIDPIIMTQSDLQRKIIVNQFFKVDGQWVKTLVNKGVPLMTKDNWDVLTGDVKRTYGLIAVTNANEGYKRGTVYNGEEYYNDSYALLLKGKSQSGGDFGQVIFLEKVDAGLFEYSHGSYEIEIEFKLDSVYNGNNAIIGLSWETYGVIVHSYGDKIVSASGNSICNITYPSDIYTNYHTIRISKYKTIFDGTEYDLGSTTVIAGGELVLGGGTTRNSGASSNCYGNIYYKSIKVYYDNSILHYFVPFKDSDDKVCLHDMITGLNLYNLYEDTTGNLELVSIT